jgi:hypothetical protein
MPREIRPELEDLLATPHCGAHTTLDIILVDESEWFFSTGEIFVDRFDKTQQYSARLERDVGELDLSLGVDVDMQEFEVTNVDPTFGQKQTKAIRELDEAKAVTGILFIDPDFPSTEAIWDAKMPGKLFIGEISDSSVSMTLMSSIDSVVVSGRTIADEFQWREPISTVPLLDPNDSIHPGIGTSGGNQVGNWKGRYGDEIISPYLMM